jgi:hypothetical protein
MTFTQNIKTDAHENLLLAAYFQTIYPTDFGSTFTPSARSVYYSLHTGDPGVNGAQNTTEAQGGSFGYSRPSEGATNANFTVASAQATNVNSESFGLFTAGAASETYTHLGIGSGASGAGVLFYRALLQTSLLCEESSSPTLEVGDLIVGEK